MDQGLDDTTHKTGVPQIDLWRETGTFEIKLIVIIKGSDLQNNNRNWKQEALAIRGFSIRIFGYLIIVKLGYNELFGTMVQWGLVIRNSG